MHPWKWKRQSKFTSNHSAQIATLQIWLSAFIQACIKYSVGLLFNIISFLMHDDFNIATYRHKPKSGNCFAKQSSLVDKIRSCDIFDDEYLQKCIIPFYSNSAYYLRMKSALKCIKWKTKFCWQLSSQSITSLCTVIESSLSWNVCLFSKQRVCLKDFE